MIYNLAKKLADRLLKKGSISEDEQELYIYGLFMLLSNLMYLLLACFLGLTFGCVLESLIFYIAFQLIRKYAGGYHASTETRCGIMSTLSILACIVVIKLSKTFDFQTVLLALSTVSAICIFVLCPIDTPEKPLSDNEAKYFRKVSQFILAVMAVIVAVSYNFKFKIILVPCCISLVLESILIIAGKIKKVLQVNKAQQHNQKHSN